MASTPISLLLLPRFSVYISIDLQFILTILSGRERDTTEQLIGSIDEVIEIVTELVQGSMDWPSACHRLPMYDGKQAID